MIIMTYNVRYQNEKDGRHSWSNRKDPLTDTILRQNPDVLSLQEAKPVQLKDIDEKLTQYARVGEGRMREGKPDEHVPIYYKKDKFDLIESKTLWFSLTPEVPGSMSWDTTLPRIYTYAVLENKKDKKRFVVINTHLEHKGHNARLKSTQILLDRAKSFSYMPVVLTGDYNMTEDYPGYKVMTGDGYLKDARYCCKTNPVGPIISTNGFGAFEQEKAIDFVFVNERFSVLSHEIIENNEGDFYPSDHYPIVCTLETVGV